MAKLVRSGIVRTCVGCRFREAKSELLRLVVAGDEIVPDPRGRLPGRGAYLHPDLRCLKQAERRRAFPRAFRRPGPLGIGPLADYLGARHEVAAAGQAEGTTEQQVGKAGRQRDERPMSTRR